MKNRAVLSVDPGIAGTGWALWDDGSLKKYGTVLAASQKHWHEKAISIGVSIHKIVEENNVETMYVEEPSFMPSQGGQVTAASGALVKLAFVVGAICASSGVEVVLVSVNKWKGQLKKDVVENRIRRLIPKLRDVKEPSHVFDAIGIGWYAQGRSINEMPKM